MRNLCTLLIFASIATAADLCPSGISLGEFRLVAHPPPGDTGLPMHTLNRIPGGSRIVYTPTKPLENKKGEVALLAANADQSQLVLLEPKKTKELKTKESLEWTIPTDISLVALIWGPDGLDEGRIKRFGERERPVILQLARYAEQTAMTETLLKALSGNSTQGVDTAISSFAAQYGTGGRLDRTAPPDQQMLTMLRSINPALASYDPLAPESSARLQQSAMLAASVAGMFFGSTVGVGAGSAALLVNMRTLLFPKLAFKSSFVQPSNSGSVALCGRTATREPRTRPAYVWAFQVANAPTPELAFATRPAVLPAGVKSAISLKLSKGTWNTVRQIREWGLVDSTGAARAITIKFGEEGRAEMDIPTDLAAGTYELTGKLDWDNVPIAGPVEVVAIPDLSVVAPDSESHDRIVTGAKSVRIQLTGGDFRFLDQLSWRMRGQTWPEPKSIPFHLEQGNLVTELDLTDRAPGEYVFLLKQRGNRQDEAVFRVLAPAPELEKLPLRVNVGETEQRVQLHGKGLDQIAKVEIDGLQVELEKDTLISKRNKELEAGHNLDLRLRLKHYQHPVVIPGGVRVAGPLPRVSSVRVAAQQAYGVDLRSGEIAAGTQVTVEAKVDNAGGSPLVRLMCRSGGVRAVTLHSGETSPDGRVRDMQGVLLISVDPGAVGGSGCELQLEVETENGMSPRSVVGRVVRIPRLSKLSLTDEPAGEGLYYADIEGEELELLAQVGWTAADGVPVRNLPVATGGSQRLRIVLPWPAPSPRARLFLWLHGDLEGRRTELRF